MVKCTPRPPHLWFYLALLIMFSKCHYDFYKCDSCLLLHPYSPGKTISIEPAQVLSRFGLTPECLTLCNSMDCSLPGCSVHGILQARRLEWVAISSSRGSSRHRDRTHVSDIFCIGRQVLDY